MAGNINHMRAGLRQVSKLGPAGHKAPNDASRIDVITSVDPRGVGVSALRPKSPPDQPKMMSILSLPLPCRNLRPYEPPWTTRTVLWRSRCGSSKIQEPKGVSLPARFSSSTLFHSFLFYIWVTKCCNSRSSSSPTVLGPRFGYWSALLTPALTAA
jgi:hypothetical protein